MGSKILIPDPKIVANLYPWQTACTWQKLDEILKKVSLISIYIILVTLGPFIRGKIRLSRINGTLRRILAKFQAKCAVMTKFIRLWNSPQGGSFNFRCPCKNLIRIQLIATNLSWLVYFASLMEDELRRKTDTICITMRSRANFKAGMKVARSSGKASSVFGPLLAKQR